MNDNFAKFKHAISAALRSSYFFIFCAISTLLLTFIKKFFLDLCIYGILTISACSIHRIPMYEGFYSFSIIYSYLIVLFIFLIFVGIVSILDSEKSVSEIALPKKRVCIILIIPMFSSLFFISNLYRPFRSALTRDAIMDCCEGKLTTRWGVFNKIDKDQHFCLVRRRAVVENICIFPLKKNE